MFSTVFTYITTHFMESLTVILIALLFFKEQLTKLIYFRFGVEQRNGNGGEDRRGKNNIMFGEVNRLSNYYNHDLTDRLEKIQASTDKTVSLLEELKEYGIKIRQ